MTSLALIFFGCSLITLLIALTAIWNSLRFAQGRVPIAIETAHDLPEHAALVDEKNSLLRAIKDLEYEHAVGKMSDADFQRLDSAYRARAKQVLALLDRDVKPLYERAERMIADYVAKAPVRVSAKSGEVAKSSETAKGTEHDR